MAPSSSSSSGNAGNDRPAYATADSQWVPVTTWEGGLVASGLTVQRIKYKKLTTGVKHEYLLFDVSDNTRFVTERDDKTPPDYTMTRALDVDKRLATLTLSEIHPLPERTFARILTKVSRKAPVYGLVSNNCYWYAGSVFETIRVSLPNVHVDKTRDWGDRGKVEVPVLWWKVKVPVGSAPQTVTISSTSPPVGVGAGATAELPAELPAEPPAEPPSYQRVIKEFGQKENLEAYEKVHKKNVGDLKDEFDDDDVEKQLTIALRGLVGFILHDLAGPLEAGEEFEDLPALKRWLKEDRISPSG